MNVRKWVFFILLLAGGMMLAANTPSFNWGHGSMRPAPVLSLERPYEFDWSRFEYMPEYWCLWYRCYGVGCGTWIEEEYDTQTQTWEFRDSLDLVWDNNRLTEIRMYSEEGNSKYSFGYAEGCIYPVDIVNSIYNGADPYEVYREHWNYDANGVVTSAYGDNYDDTAGWVPNWRATVTLDNAQASVILIENHDGSTWYQSQRMNLTWNNGNLTQLMQYSLDGETWLEDFREDITWLNDCFDQQVMYNWGGTQWFPTERHTFTFDSGLWQSELIEDYSNDMWVTDWRGDMTYSENGRFEMQTGYEWNGQNWVLDERARFIYDADAGDDQVVPLPDPALRVAPNPFNPSTTVSFTLTAPERVSLAVYNVRGEKMVTLADDVFVPGTHNVVWNGLDQQGQKASSGVYIMRMMAGGKAFIQKTMLLK